MLKNAAELFSSHYGVWAAAAPEKMDSFAKPGERIRMTPERLRAQCLPADAIDRCIYVRAEFNDTLVGNVFACGWQVDGRDVVWVTQLVVDTNFRSRRIATRLLEQLREPGVRAFGIMSSHAHSCMAAVNAFCGSSTRYPLGSLYL